MGRFIDKTGERFINNIGACEFVIVEYNGSNDVWIEFQDKYKARIHTNIQACRNGVVKNPYHPSMCGVGCLGLMPDGSKPITRYDKGMPTREYNLWGGMIARCYGNYECWNTYEDVTVCERWLIFANFLEDLPLIEGYELWKNNPNTGVSLDKDSKIKGNKIYSLETCKFISKSNNSKESIRRSGNPNPSQKVIAISLTKTKVLIFKSMRQAEKLGFDHGRISECCKGKQKSHKGYKWKYI